MKVFFVYCILHAAFVLACTLAIYKYHSYPSYIFYLRIHLVFEYLLVTYFFYCLLKSSLVKKILLFLIFPFLVYNVYDYILFGNEVFGNGPTLAELLIFMAVIIYYFFEKMQYYFQFPIYQTIDFWIFVGLFVYSSGIFFYILLFNNSNKSDLYLINELKIIYSIVIIIKNLILGLAFVNSNLENAREEKVLDIPSDLNLDSFSPNTNLN